jgi:hypothetical protein
MPWPCMSLAATLVLFLCISQAVYLLAPPSLSHSGVGTWAAYEPNPLPAADDRAVVLNHTW